MGKIQNYNTAHIMHKSGLPSTPSLVVPRPAPPPLPRVPLLFASALSASAVHIIPPRFDSLAAFLRTCRVLATLATSAP